MPYSGTTLWFFPEPPCPEGSPCAEQYLMPHVEAEIGRPTMQAPVVATADQERRRIAIHWM